MISYNSKLKFPQLVIRETKYDTLYYLANNLDELLDTAYKIVQEWIDNDELDYLSDQKHPEVDLLNANKAKLTPWQFAPYTKLDQINFIMDNIESYSNGKTPALLEETFKQKPELREKWDNLHYWKLKSLHIVNDDHGEYMNVSSQPFSTFS